MSREGKEEAGKGVERLRKRKNSGDERKDGGEEERAGKHKWRRKMSGGEVETRRGRESGKAREGWWRGWKEKETGRRWIEGGRSRTWKGRLSL